MTEPLEVLTAVKEITGDGEAVIAGGFVRDTLLGKEPKDVDIWYHTGPSAPFIVQELAAKFDGVPQIVEAKPQRGYAQNIKSLGKIIIGEYPYDLIQTPYRIGVNADSLLDHFDFGICRVAMDTPDGGTLIRKPEFLEDVNNKTLTVYIDSLPYKDLLWTLRDHLPRVTAKFPEYGLRFK